MPYPPTQAPRARRRSTRKDTSPTAKGHSRSARRQAARNVETGRGDEPAHRDAVPVAQADGQQGQRQDGHRLLARQRAVPTARRRAPARHHDPRRSPQIHADHGPDAQRRREQVRPAREPGDGLDAPREPRPLQRRDHRGDAHGRARGEAGDEPPDPGRRGRVQGEVRHVHRPRVAAPHANLASRLMNATGR